MERAVLPQKQDTLVAIAELAPMFIHIIYPASAFLHTKYSRSFSIVML